MSGLVNGLRLLLATLLAGGALLVPAPGWAAAGMHSISTPIAGLEGDPEGGALLRLELFFKSDGRTHASGFLYTGTQRLTARANEPVQASFADSDRNGVAGLTEFVAPLSPTGTREHVLLARGIPDREIDESGNYELLITDIRTGQTLFTGTVRVAVGDIN